MRAVPETEATVPAVVELPPTWNSPRPTAPTVKSPVPVKEKAPFVAMAPVVPVVASKTEPEVRPVPDETNRATTEVVAAVPDTFRTVAPVVTLSATTCKRPAFEVDVYAAVAVMETIPLVATAPVVPVETRMSEPVVVVTEDEAKERPMPVVRASRSLASMAVPVVMDEPVTSRITPAARAPEAESRSRIVSSDADVENSLRTALVFVAAV